jgi:hypothetical protein
MSVFSSSGHGNLLARPHATNRLGTRPANTAGVEGGQQQQQSPPPQQRSDESFRPSKQIAGAYSRPGDSSTATDDVWAVDMAPLALGAAMDSSPGPGEAPYTVEPNGTLCGDSKGGVRSIEAEVRMHR